MKKAILLSFITLFSLLSAAQINTDRVILIGRNALYFEDYILAIQYFNQAIKSKPHLAEPYYYRAIAKFYLDDVRGTEEDCSLALERNPFMVRAYQLRADARQALEEYDGAVEDYAATLKSYPNDKFALINLGVVNIQKKNYDKAQETLDQLLKIYPQYAQGYLTRGAMYQERGDTIKAFDDFDQAIKVDKYLPQSYSMRGLLYYNKEEFDKSLADFDEAIRLDPLQPGNYINRGLVRYSKNDLRGAMADYDKVIDLEKNNTIARFNRGLLRAQVGDDNRAIEDFDVVLNQEPNNYMAYLNRAFIKKNVGNYKGALDDLNRVLAEYPEYYQGFYMRAEIKNKQNDLKGAERDYNYARNEENRIHKELVQGKTEETDKDKTRERSDKDIDKFNRLVVADKSEQEKNKYDNNTRGKIQNQQVSIEPEPRFVVTYYEKINDLKRFVYFSQLVDGMNKKNLLPKKLRITNREAALNERQIQEHFSSIDNLSKQIADRPRDPSLYFARAIDYMLVQDFASSIEDYNKVIELKPEFAALAYFDQAVVYSKQAESKISNSEIDKVSEKKELAALGGVKKDVNIASVATVSADKMDYDVILRNYNKVIELNPEFIYAYFNRAEIRYKQQDFRAAVLDYNEALRRDPEFAEAYYNRGLARFQLNDKNRALEDMRKAGELGIVEAYSIIKRMTE